jgi:hypothetical protein
MSIVETLIVFTFVAPALGLWLSWRMDKGE